MSFFLNGDLGDFDAADLNESTTSNDRRTPARKDDLPLLAEKLDLPAMDVPLFRRRLHDLLDRSCAQFGGTLISGRAGAGKTTLAAEYAKGKNDTSWYSIDPADADWNVFSQYFYASVTGKRKGSPRITAIDTNTGVADQPAMAEFLVDCFSNSSREGGPELIVLDNVHHLFDADWFCDFFTLMLHSLTPGAHALMLCRSRPPAPLWRLRSKQVLNVIDEKLLAFTLAETEEFCGGRGIPAAAARRAYVESFGRPSRLVEAVNFSKKKTKTPI